MANDPGKDALRRALKRAGGGGSGNPPLSDADQDHGADARRIDGTGGLTIDEDGPGFESAIAEFGGLIPAYISLTATNAVGGSNNIQVTGTTASMQASSGNAILTAFTSVQVSAGSGDLALSSTSGDVTVQGTKTNAYTDAEQTKLAGIETGATATGDPLADADQDTGNVLRTISGSGASSVLRMVYDNGGSNVADILVQPSLPRILNQVTNGTNVTGISLGSANLNIVLTGTPEIRLNGQVGQVGQFIGGQGAGTPNVWTNRYKTRWYESDFYSNDVRQQGPWNWVATSAGTTTAAPAAAALTDDVWGFVTIRSSASANSGGRWQLQMNQWIHGRPGTFYKGIFRFPSTFATKTAKLGFFDSVTDTVLSADGAYFTISTSGVATANTAQGGTRTANATTFTLSVDTWYVFEVEWNSSSSVDFRIKSVDETTTHLDVENTTNIPSGGSQLFTAGVTIESSGTTAIDLCQVDYMGVGLLPYRDGI